MPRVASFDELNCHLLAACRRDDVRVVHRQSVSIGQAWQEEQPYLRPLPSRPFDCCVIRQAHLNGYSQVTYETNRYSVPAEQARQELTLKAYPFEVHILFEGTLLARHARCYEREQDVFEPLHYLWLLEQRAICLRVCSSLTPMETRVAGVLPSTPAPASREMARGPRDQGICAYPPPS